MSVAATTLIEGLDRARNKLEDLRQGGPERTVAPSHLELRREVSDRFGYTVDDVWETRLRAQVGAGAGDRVGFESTWHAMARDLADGPGAHGLDADPALARAVWTIVRALRPAVVVETGVARGITSRTILEALAANGHGHLWSIDLPPRAVDAADHARAVPDALRERWTLCHGASRRLLPRLLRELETVDVFIHDSQHTERNMRFELERAWRVLRPGGVVVADDVHENAAWQRFTADVGVRGIVAQEDVKAGMFGIARRD
jgi:predicted O-methyltransferase YrrM